MPFSHVSHKRGTAGRCGSFILLQTPTLSSRYLLHSRYPILMMSLTIYQSLVRVGKAFSAIGGNLTLPISPASPRRFTMQLLLSYSIDGSDITLIQEDWILNSTIQFRGKFGNALGEPFINDSVSATRTTVTCDHSTFEETTKLMEDTFKKFDTALGTVALNSIRYQTDCLSSRDAYYACTELVQDLLEPADIVEAPVATQACYYSPDTLEYGVDPCW